MAGNKLKPLQAFDFTPQNISVYGWNSAQTNTSTTTYVKISGSELTITVPARRKLAIMASGKANLMASSDNKRCYLALYQKIGAATETLWGYIAMTDSVRQITLGTSVANVFDNSASDTPLVIKFGLWFLCVDASMTATHHSNYEVQALCWFI